MRFRGKKSLLLVSLIAVAIALTVICSAQEQTVARLNHDAAVALPHASISTTSKTPQYSHSARASALPDSSIARAAANALFVTSDLNRAARLSEQVLRREPKNAEALFVRMEVAAIEGDTATMLDSALRLCEAGEQSPADPRVRLAAVRVRESAGNTPEFRSAIPRIRTLLANSQQQWPDLQEGLLTAAMDGVPTLNPYAISRAAGILTDWRIVGPFSHEPLDLDDSISSADDLSRTAYFNRAVENFQFPDGRIVLPEYLSHHGTFYAAGRFSSLMTAQWHLSVESGNSVEVYVDGQRLLRGVRDIRESTFEASPGPHRVLVKFPRAAAPLRIAITPAVERARTPLPLNISSQEAAYLLAAGHYAGGDYEDAAKQISAVPLADSSAALQFLLAESITRGSSASNQAHAITPAAMTAELWQRRIAAHPSCQNLRQAVDFYRADGKQAMASAALQQLDGCAPESLDYARALSREGNHAEAARALRQLTAAAPLNRAARLMLIRELQLAGEDRDAQQAAAEWLHIAPNAENYHRLAAAETESEGNGAAFYAPYRRDAADIARDAAGKPEVTELTLLDDHVAIARPDGSVSLYVHQAKRFATETAARAAIASLPPGAEVLNDRILLVAGSATIVDQEYLLHYAGDGGIPEHPEVFQFVFGSFGSRVLHSRFVVLTSAERADRGTVIASGNAPKMTSAVKGGLLQRMWSRDETSETGAESAVLPFSAPPIIRIVEQENGWSVPSNAEHQRRIETIHPGPRPEDS